jgi:hypothetical protein
MGYTFSPGRGREWDAMEGKFCYGRTHTIRDSAQRRGEHGRAVPRWYKTEKAEISKLEKGKRLAANKVFLERIEREVRLGGRMAIIADLRIPDLPQGVATVVNVHLENKCKPECRIKQMDALLSQIKEVEHPVIVAGDLNTSGTDGTPTSIRREILNRVKNYEFWVTQALRWGTPASLPLAALTPVNYFKNYLDPTSTHLPVIGSNKEAILFRHVERFRFVDRMAFDFRGSTPRTTKAGRSRTATSERVRDSSQLLRLRLSSTGTDTLERDFGGLVGRYKLDWIFVKPYIPHPRGRRPGTHQQCRNVISIPSPFQFSMRNRSLRVAIFATLHARRGRQALSDVLIVRSGQVGKGLRAFLSSIVR